DRRPRVSTNALVVRANLTRFTADTVTHLNLRAARSIDTAFSRGTGRAAGAAVIRIGVRVRAGSIATSLSRGTAGPPRAAIARRVQVCASSIATALARATDSAARATMAGRHQIRAGSIATALT